MAIRSCERKKLNGPICAGTIQLGIVSTGVVRSFADALAKTAKDGQAAPKAIDGQLVTRVAMGIDVLAHLHQQIQQVLVDLRETLHGKAKGLVIEM